MNVLARRLVAGFAVTAGGEGVLPIGRATASRSVHAAAAMLGHAAITSGHDALLRLLPLTRYSKLRDVNT